ncbi:hypothetical protein K438DRAFT_1964379 [Mycena galopus ATCC 62051]|nr:hypothetical protein K438DRAFT_1964379 [Mycena galopus ATCC 62051]
MSSFSPVAVQVLAQFSAEKKIEILTTLQGRSFSLAAAVSYHRSLDLKGQISSESLLASLTAFVRFRFPVKLYFHPAPHSGASGLVSSTIEQSLSTTQSSRLLALPVEIIKEIYSSIEYLSDFMCLSMTCQHLWNIGRREIYDCIANTVNFSWAGGRIICVGDYLRNEDIPEGLLTPDEKEEFTGWDEEEDERYALYQYPFTDISAPRGRFNMHDFVLHSLVPTQPDYQIWAKYYLSLLALVDTEYRIPAPTQPSVLRNLSRCVYVREAALIAWRQGIKIDVPREIGFGEIVLSRISWSSEGSVSMTWDGDIHRGVWAGDRFDIVNSDWLEGLGDDDTAAAAAWTDVSDEVLKEMEGIWTSEYGSLR